MPKIILEAGKKIPRIIGRITKTFHNSDIKIVETTSMLSGDIFQLAKNDLLENSVVFDKVKNLYLKFAPIEKQSQLINNFEQFVKNKEDLKVVEQLYNGVEKSVSNISQQQAIKTYNRIFKNIKILREHHPQDYKTMVDGKFFDLVEQGKIDLYNFKTNFENVRVSRSVLNDLKKIASGEEFIPDYSHLSLDKIRSLVKNGDVYLYNGKLFTRNHNMELEIQLSKEKFDELFPPVLRYMSNQGHIGNCWLVGRIDNLMSSEEGRGKIYSLFKQVGDDIYITMPNTNKSILFPKGKALTSSKKMQMNSCEGLKMLEQASAIHAVNLYSKEPVTNVQEFSDIDNLMKNLIGSNWKARIKMRDKEFLEIFSGEYIDYVNRENPYNAFRKGNSISFGEVLCKAFGMRNNRSLQQNKKNMSEIINRQGNRENLHINIDFIDKVPYEYRDLYNMVKNHQLTIKAVEDGKIWVSNPWFNWIEKGVDEKIFYDYLKSVSVPAVWE